MTLERTDEGIPETPDWYKEPESEWQYIKHVPEHEKVGEWGLKCVESWDVEALYSERTERFILRWFRLTCECGREWSPLMSTYTRILWSGWHWVGISHQEPVTLYTTTCRLCGRRYSFELTVGQ